MVTAEKQHDTKVLKIVFKDIVNPDQGTTAPFEIKTTFDSLVLDATDTSTTTARTLDISAKPQSITQISLKFDPKNEGEESNYQFEFTPTNKIEESVS
jgi:hypothetical protein